MATDDLAWSDLLGRAYLIDGEKSDGVYGILHGLRCCGVRLVPAQEGYRLVRDPTGELSEDEYQAIRARYLVPHAAQLRELLRRVRR